MDWRGRTAGWGADLVGLVTANIHPRGVGAWGRYRPLRPQLVDPGGRRPHTLLSVVQRASPRVRDRNGKGRLWSEGKKGRATQGSQSASGSVGNGSGNAVTHPKE